MSTFIVFISVPAAAVDFNDTVAVHFEVSTYLQILLLPEGTCAGTWKDSDESMSTLLIRNILAIILCDGRPMMNEILGFIVAVLILQLMYM